jgi:RHS repeat-associated protein
MTETYTYDTNKKNAVVQVQNSGNLIPKENVDVTYNAFNKVATVTQGSNKLTITYGPDRQRTKTVLVNGSNTTTTLYADNYEQRTVNGTTTTYHYVASPDGLAAVYVKKNGTTTPYYVETDHLGSIINLFDASGTKQFSATYDAWGKQTITKNAMGLTRGYTGHEHWNQFGLIDMNGRFYDPLIGRFLSPDPYVQAPSNLQNFNRYSYCLNNPLKYTDPTGESIVGACIVTAVYMYVYGTMANSHSDNPFNPADWNWKSGSTYTALASGAMQGLGFAGVPLAIDGAISNGFLQSGISVTINGIGNVIDNENFFEGAVGPAIMGFAGGALSGYMSAQENGKNLWWGNKVKYGRTKWSFFNCNKPDEVINFGINNVGSRQPNDCLPTSCAEIEAKRNGARSYEDFVGLSQYKEGVGVTTSGIDLENYLCSTFDNVETLSRIEYGNLFNPDYMRSAANNGEVFCVNFSNHIDNVRTLQVFKNAPHLNKITFRQGRYNMRNAGTRYPILNIFRFF